MKEYVGKELKKLIRSGAFQCLIFSMNVTELKPKGMQQLLPKKEPVRQKVKRTSQDSLPPLPPPVAPPTPLLHHPLAGVYVGALVWVPPACVPVYKCVRERAF